MNLQEYKRELVISRLKKTAANLWGYQESETEGFDPVIDLLVGTCATEFERISTDIHISQSRILEKVAQTILPEVTLKPYPSHAILHARPVKPEHFLKNDDQFVFDKEYIGDSPGKIENKKLYFSPALSMKLIDAEPVILATSHEIFKYSNGTVKESIAQNSTYKIPVNNSIWIALKIDINIKSLKNISFYFNWPDNPERDKLIKLLPFSQWSVDNTRIDIKSGFSETIHREYRNLKTDIFSFIDINRGIEKKLLNLYQESFITINQDIMPSKQNFPAEFESFYSEDILDQMKEDYAWIKIDFPELFPVNHLSSTFCMLNAFPVINRRLHNSNRPITLSEDLDIIPLLTDDFFLSIRKIISSNQINYQEVPFCKAGDFPPGTYTIRT